MLSISVRKILFSLTITVTFLLTSGFAQEQERVIDKLSWRNEPIKISGLKSKEKAIELGRSFAETDNWLDGLTVKVQNTSDKAISYVEIKLLFPRSDSVESEDIPIYLVRMKYGQDPSSDAEVQKQVLPGDSVEVKLPRQNLAAIKQDLENMGYPEKITRARIVVGSVTFSDGSSWEAGKIMHPDPANPDVKTIKPPLGRLPPPPADFLQYYKL